MSPPRRRRSPASGLCPITAVRTSVPDPSDGYKVLDNAMSQRLAANNALDTIATWAPREPEQVYTPLSTGAGRYRALGG